MLWFLSARIVVVVFVEGSKEFYQNQSVVVEEFIDMNSKLYSHRNNRMSQNTKHQTNVGMDGSLDSGFWKLEAGSWKLDHHVTGVK